MDTESLIKMVKEQHAKSQSDADKQIQAKLGQLSSKLSWVVEYPKDSAGDQPKMPMPMAMFPPGMGNFPVDYLEDEEEDEEDYNEEDFDEDELDEQDRAALAYMRKMQETARATGQRPGHFEGEIGDEEYEDYDEMMEGFDEQHRLYNPAENVPMPQYEGEENQQPAFQPYQRSSSPSLDNFLLMGQSMAKCLVCNKIIRKTEIKQHNKIHEEEMDEDGERGEEEGEGAEGEFREEEEEEVHDMGDDYDQTDDYHGEEDMGEEIDMEDMAEFTAEPLVAEQLTPTDTTLTPSKKAEKPTVCEICNKSFVSYYNMIRHQKTHNGAKDIKCPLCDKNFKQPSYLTKHLKKVHPDYVPQAAAGAGVMAGAGAGTGTGAGAGVPVGSDGDAGQGAQDGGADIGREKEKVQTSS